MEQRRVCPGTSSIRSRSFILFLLCSAVHAQYCAYVPSSTGSLQSSNSSKNWRIDGGILIQELPVAQCTTTTSTSSSTSSFTLSSSSTTTGTRTSSTSSSITSTSTSKTGTSLTTSTSTATLSSTSSSSTSASSTSTSSTSSSSTLSSSISSTSSTSTSGTSTSSSSTSTSSTTRTTTSKTTSSTSSTSASSTSTSTSSTSLTSTSTSSTSATSTSTSTTSMSSTSTSGTSTSSSSTSTSSTTTTTTSTTASSTSSTSASSTSTSTSSTSLTSTSTSSTTVTITSKTATTSTGSTSTTSSTSLTSSSSTISTSSSSSTSASSSSTSSTSRTSSSVSSTRSSTSSATSSSTTRTFTSTSSSTSGGASEMRWCRKYHAGVPVESAVCQAGSLQHDHCLTKVDSADVPCDAETSSACCVASAAQSGDTSCDRCATVIVEEDLEIYNMSGEIRWAPFGSSEAEELLLGGYRVSVIDECGSELAFLGDVAVRSGFFRSGAAECCASDWYLLILTFEMVPRAATALAISTWQENLATTIPIFERTTTTSTTMTVTSSSTSKSTSSSSWTTVSTTTVTVTAEAPAMVEGCMTLSVSDASLFAESSDAKEAIRKMVSKVAAVDSLYVQDIRIYAGESCPGARRLEQRRLQEAMRFDYVIAFPASLGVGLAVQAAETSRQLLRSATVQEVTQILVEEVQNVPAISNVVVSVTSISVPIVSVLGTTTVMLPASDAPPTGDDDILAVAAIFLGLFFPVSLFVVYSRCQKRSNAVDDGERVKISVEAEQAIEETEDTKGDPPSGDEEGDKSVEPESSKVLVRKKKKRLKPPRNKAGSPSLTNTQVMVESSPAPPELEAIDISWLEDEGVLGLDRPPNLAQLTPALPWEDGVLFDRSNNTFVHESQSWLEEGVIHDRHVSRGSCISHVPVMSQDELAEAGVLFDQLDGSWRNTPQTPLFEDVEEVSQKSAAGSSAGEEVTASLAFESVPKTVKKKVVISAKVPDNTESEALEEENAENSTGAKPKRVRKKVVKKSTKESISTANERKDQG